MSKTKSDDQVGVVMDPAGEQDAPKKKDPAPGDSDYDWAQHYGTDELFSFKFADGKVVALRQFGSIYSETFLYKLRKAQSNAEFRFAAIDRGACAEAQGVIESIDAPMDADPVRDLFEAWAAAGTSRGEGDEGLTSGKSPG